MPRLPVPARILLPTVLALVALPGGPARAGTASSPALRRLTVALRSGIQAAGPAAGAEVVDLSTGETLFAVAAGTPRTPASVEKLYTTSAALAEYGAGGRLRTTVLGVGSLRDGTFRGTLYLRGGGDPTFGSAGFDRLNYGGAGATVEELARRLAADAHIRALQGTIVADESRFDSRRGTPFSGYAPSLYTEGELSGLAFDRGWVDSSGNALQPRPALAAGRAFAAALQRAGVRLGRGDLVRTGVTPAAAQTLATMPSPPMSRLIALTNTPSDNFFAEMLLKDLGADYGTGGSTPAGARVVRSVIAARFGLHPRLIDGSGLSSYDRSSPQTIVSLLRQQASDRPFVSSLAVAGRTGTLAHELAGTYATGRCRGKTGTLPTVSNVVGYCRARDGHTLAYALLMNQISAAYAHPIQNRMELALARYDG